MFIVYTGTDNEVIVTTPELEPEMLKEYFADYTGRDLEEYDREVTNRGAAVVFSSDIKRDW
jgi:hypothetical protein